MSKRSLDSISAEKDERESPKRNKEDEDEDEFTTKKRELNQLCASGTFEQARDAYNAIMKRFAGAFALHELFEFLKHLIKAASGNSDVLIYIAKDWIETNKSGENKDEDLDFVHFFLASAHHLVEDPQVRFKFVDTLVKKYRVTDVLLLLQLNRFEEAIKMIRENQARDPDWWRTLSYSDEDEDAKSWVSSFDLYKELLKIFLLAPRTQDLLDANDFDVEIPKDVGCETSCSKFSWEIKRKQK